ncbi:MAG TPA: response regulator [Anaeromyxobacteraceae bacterium]|nr:response regulator [Anaeromyxobacteraceae bacterium]
MTTSSPTPSPKSPRALLLASDRRLRRRVRRDLEGRGFEVVAAGDGEKGLSLLLDELLRLDVLVLDLALAGRDGWSLVRLIRESGGERELPIVVVSARQDDGLRRRLLALGADAVVSPEDAARCALLLGLFGRAAHAAPPPRPVSALPMLPALACA